MRRNPARRLQREMTRAARIATRTAEEQASPTVSASQSFGQAGIADATSGDWVAFGRWDIDTWADFRFGP